MRKEDELSKEHTCMQHAHPKEMVFVLLSRDAAAPVAIRAWVAERIRLGKNIEAATRARRSSMKQAECTVCQGLGSIESTGLRCLTCGGSGWTPVGEIKTLPSREVL
jgi:hypothetical protein